MIIWLLQKLNIVCFLGLISNSLVIDYSELPSSQERLVNNVPSNYFSDTEH